MQFNNSLIIMYGEKAVDMAESVSEEINLLMGFDTRVVNSSIIELDTVAGRMKHSCSESTIMGNVYRFINHYGLKISNWGLQEKIKERRSEPIKP